MQKLIFGICCRIVYYISFWKQALDELKVFLKNFWTLSLSLSLGLESVYLMCARVWPVWLLWIVLIMKTQFFISSKWSLNTEILRFQLKKIENRAMDANRNYTAQVYLLSSVRYVSWNMLIIPCACWQVCVLRWLRQFLTLCIYLGYSTIMLAIYENIGQLEVNIADEDNNLYWADNPVGLFST